MTELLKKKSYSVIVGMGATGFSVAQFLYAKKLPFVVFDTRRDVSLGEKFLNNFGHIPLIFEEIDTSLLLDAKEIIVSPGVALSAPWLREAVERNIPILGDIELFLRHCNKAVVGITGSNGKSTLTTLVGMVLKEADFNPGVGGNIGVPALNLLNQNHDIYVLELSSFQLETTLNPGLEVACILNVSEDHMDRYDSFEAYKQAKHRIYRGANNVIFCTDDSNSYPSDDVTISRLGFGCQTRLEKPYPHYYLDKKDGFIKVGERCIEHKDELGLKGLHNMQNVLALLTICHQLGISEHISLDVLREFKGLPHRCEFVGNFNGISFINDSKATNVGAAKAAIEGLRSDFNRILLIAGGEGKGADFREFTKTINTNIAHIVLMGKDAQFIADGIHNSVGVEFAEDLTEAVKKITAKAKIGDAVLLSPACASFDMFSGFEERGEQFVVAVKEMQRVS